MARLLATLLGASGGGLAFYFGLLAASPTGYPTAGEASAHHLAILVTSVAPIVVVLALLTMSVGLVHFLFVGAFLFAAGAFLVARRPSYGAALAGIPLLLGGAGLDLTAGSRFAARRILRQLERRPITGIPGLHELIHSGHLGAAGVA